MRKKREELESKFKNYKAITDAWMYKIDLRKPGKAKKATELIIEVLDITNEEETLKEFMHYTQYSIFGWAIQNHNMDILDFLLTKLKPEYHFLMVEHDDFKPLKEFINNCLRMPTSDDQEGASIKEEILSKLISIDPDTIMPIIKQHIANTKENGNYNITHHTYTAFEKCLESAQKTPITLRKVIPLTANELALGFFKEKVEVLEKKVRGEESQQANVQPYPAPLTVNELALKFFKKKVAITQQKVDREKNQEECDSRPNKRQCTTTSNRP